jgi:hypothetical protein
MPFVLVGTTDQSVQSIRMGRPNKVFPFKVAAFSHASVFQNSTNPLRNVKPKYSEQRRQGGTKYNPHQANITYTPLKSPESLWCSHRTAFTSASRAPKNFVIASSSISYESFLRERREKRSEYRGSGLPRCFLSLGSDLHFL